MNPPERVVLFAILLAGSASVWASGSLGGGVPAASAEAQPPLETGAITGTVTRAATGLPVPDATVYFYSGTGSYRGSAVTSGQGIYVSPGLPTGTYFVQTYVSPESGLIDEIFDDIRCYRGSCSPTAGTPVAVSAPATTDGIDFVLSTGGRISGVVTNATTTMPVEGAAVEFYDSVGSYLASTSTNTQGAYTSPGLPTGSYFVRTSGPYGSGLVGELFEDIPCPTNGCYVTTGTPVAVTLSETTANISFALSPGGRISGVVTNAVTTLPIAGTWLHFYDRAGYGVGSVPADAQGVYTSSALPAGSYFVRAAALSASDVIDELFDNIPCFGYCSVTSGVPVAVTTSGTTPVDFALSPGGVISGTVTNAQTGLPVANMAIGFYDAAGNHVRGALTNSQGAYASPGLPTGSYFVRTAAPSEAGLVDELFDNLSCYRAACSITTGTAVGVIAGATSANVDFALTPAGRISGTVTNEATGLPVADVRVDFFVTTGTSVGSSVTDAQGFYVSPGLPIGSYLVRTSAPDDSGVIDELFDGIACFHGNCSPTAGTVVSVTAATTTSVNFALSRGGRISGSITNAASGLPVGAFTTVHVYTSTGIQVRTTYTDAQGAYISRGLPTGSYFVRAQPSSWSGLSGEIFDNVPCPGWNCAVTTGTPIAVTAPATTANVDFALSPGGRITGWVTNAATGLSVPNVRVRFYTTTGTEAGSASTDRQGYYMSPPLATDSYIVITEAPADVELIDEMFDNVLCPGASCPTSAGTPVNVIAPAIVPNVNLALTTGGRISGTVTNAGSGLPVKDVAVLFYTSTGSYKASASTDEQGLYRSPALPGGSYFVRTSVSNPSVLVDECFDDTPCPGLNHPVTVGTPVAVAASATTANVDFALVPGGRISGTVTSAATGLPLAVTLNFYTADGFVGFTTTDALGAYTSPGLPAGTYFVRTSSLPDSGLVDELFGGVSCPAGSCSLAQGTGVSVTPPATTVGIDFTLATGGRIAGSVRRLATMTSVGEIWVEFYSATGNYVASSFTDLSGAYTSIGLPTGSYFIRTSVAASADLRDELYDNIPCQPGSCNVTTGTPVAVTAPWTTASVDFALATTFGKSSPANGALGLGTDVILSWKPSSGAASYQYCVDTIDNGWCDAIWIGTGSSTGATVTGLAGGTKYYWQVRANKSTGPAYADDAVSAFWSFTTRFPRPPTDFNGDGFADLVWQQDAGGRATVWHLGGPPAHVLLRWKWLAASEIPGWRIRAIADFNGDGAPDLVWQNDATRRATVWYMGGVDGATFLGWNWLTSSDLPNWTLVACADVNRDAHPDLVWQHDVTRQVIVWFMGGAAGQRLQSWTWLVPEISTGWRVAALADFNADGSRDVVWQHDDTRQITVWYMGGNDGTAFLGWNWIHQGGVPGWTVIGAAEFNQEGAADLVCQEDATREVVAWYMGGVQGNVIQSWNWLTSVPVPGWTAIIR